MNKIIINWLVLIIILCVPFSMISINVNAEGNSSDSNSEIPLVVAGMDLIWDDIYGASGTVTPVHTGIFIESRFEDQQTNTHYIIDATWYNLGDTMVPHGWKLRITLSGDQSKPSAYPAYIQDYGEPKNLDPCCGPGAYDSLNHFDITIPASNYLHGAKYTCIAGDLDNENVINEANEGNNYDASNEYWINAGLGATTNLNAKIYNYKSTTVTVSNFANPSQVPPGWTVTISPSSMSIPAHAERTIRISIYRPIYGFYNYTIVTHSYCSQYTFDVVNFIFTDPNGHIS